MSDNGWPNDGGEADAPPAPDYEDPPEEGLDLGLTTPAEWQSWPLWAKMRLLRRLRSEGSGRPEQYIDTALKWYLWAMWGGRGSGKSDEGSRWSVEDALRMDGVRFALVGRTFGDVRDTMFEGETGLLALLPDSVLRGGSRDRAYNRSLGELFLINGSRFKGFTSERPNQLRGPQHHRAWIDEASSWDDAELGNQVDTTISNLMLGLRLKPTDGSGVRVVSSTTPKPNDLTTFIDELAKKRGQVRVLSTFANLDNLDEAVADIIVGLYEGTDVAAQELEGRILSSVKGAAWAETQIEAAKAASLPAGSELEKTVVGVDPAVSSKNGSDETGLVAAARYAFQPDEQTPLDHWLEVVEDRSGTISVGDFPRAVLAFVLDTEADELLVEVNNGYDFVVNAVTAHITAEGGTVARRSRTDRTSVRTKSRQVIEYICETEDGHSFVLKPVWQSVDKLTRAKAVSVWWNRSRAVHSGEFDKLERQMVTFDGTTRKSPDRLDALTTAVAGLAVVRRRRTAGGASPLDVAAQVPPSDMNYPLLSTPAGASQSHPLLDSAR